MAPSLGAHDSIVGVVLYFVSAAVHFWAIAFPGCVVFDEMHFGGYINGYISRRFFFDVHPPFAKLLYAACAKLSQYGCSVDFSGGDYQDGWYVQFRFFNAILSSLCCPVLYFVLRNSQITPSSSLTASLCFLSEISFLPQHRLILIDGILHLFVLLTLLLLSLEPTSPFFIGICLGSVCSCKLTALSLVPFAFLRSFPLRVWSFFLSAAIAFVWFISITVVHLTVLTAPTREAKRVLSSRLYSSLF
jgi:dolichyl-phosphate-mannose-protein mannosyltransferase